MHMSSETPYLQTSQPSCLTQCRTLFLSAQPSRGRLGFRQAATMPDLGSVLVHCRIRRRDKRGARKRIDIRRNAGQHAQHPGAIKRHKLRRLRLSGAQVHDHVVGLLQPLQPCDAPAEDLCLVGQASPPRGRWLWRSPLGLPRGGEAVVLELTEPHRDLARSV
jgi:hypothetical protein